jgi:multiple sugar transport system substrate-binding protein
MKTLKRIIFGIFVLLGVLLLIKPARSREAIPPGRVEVRYWEKWSGKEADQMKQIVDEFNNTVGKEKGIWVSYLSMTAVDQKTLLATAAGVPPDIAGMWDTQVKQYAAMGALEPLDELAKAHGITRDDYKHVFWDGGCYEGHLYALPSTPGGVALHYNKLLFEKKADQLRAAGLDPDRPPRTIAELDRYSEVLDTWDANHHLLSAGYLPQEPGWWLNLTPLWFGGQVYDPKTRKVTFTDPKVIQAYTWVQGYTKRLGAKTVQDFRSSFGKDNFDSPSSPFFADTVAMEQEGPWKANYIEKYRPDMNNRHNYSPEKLKTLTREQRRENCGWGAAAFPTVDASMAPVMYASMDIIAIPSSSKHKKEAFEFMAFVNRQDIMEKLVSLHCKNSPLAKMSEQYIQNHPNPYIEVFEQLAASPNAQSLPDTPVWPEIKAELDYAIDRIGLGDVTPEQALADAQVLAQAKVDRFYQRQDQREARGDRVVSTSR